MIESLRLKNFQAHQSLTIHFDPGITTIVGRSDVGKTAVLRALQWVAFNRPQGESFITHGEAKGSARLRVDGHSILRRRGAGDNTYVLNGDAYKSFGSVPPDPIRVLLQVGEVNFQNQHDSPFWFFLTSGEVAKQLNSVVNLDLIDRTQSYLAASLRKAANAVGFAQDRLERVKGERDTLDWVDAADASLERLEGMSESLEQDRSQITHLAHLIKECRVMEERRRTLVDMVEDAHKLLKIGGEWEEVRGKRDHLRHLIEQGKVAERAARRGVNRKELGALDSLAEEVRKLQAERDSLRSLLRRVETLEKEAKEKGRLAKEAEKRLAEEVKGRCPVCGRGES